MGNPFEGMNEAEIKQTISEQVFMGALCDEFRAYLMDAIADGQHMTFADHFHFMRFALATFIFEKNSSV